MANWYGKTRSNYFGVKDVAKFKEAVGDYDVTVIEKLDPENVDAPPKVMFYTNDEGFMPTLYDEESDIGIPITNVIQDHLIDNEICVTMTAGSEKAIYVNGTAVAFDSTGKYVTVDLDDIYQKVTETFGIEASRAQE